MSKTVVVKFWSGDCSLKCVVCIPHALMAWCETERQAGWVALFNDPSAPLHPFHPPPPPPPPFRVMCDRVCTRCPITQYSWSSRFLRRPTNPAEISPSFWAQLSTFVVVYPEQYGWGGEWGGGGTPTHPFSLFYAISCSFRIIMMAVIIMFISQRHHYYQPHRSSSSASSIVMRDVTKMWSIHKAKPFTCKCSLTCYAPLFQQWDFQWILLVSCYSFSSLCITTHNGFCDVLWVVNSEFHSLTTALAFSFCGFAVMCSNE